MSRPATLAEDAAALRDLCAALADLITITRTAQARRDTGDAIDLLAARIRAELERVS